MCRVRLPLGVGEACFQNWNRVILLLQARLSDQSINQDSARGPSSERCSKCTPKNNERKGLHFQLYFFNSNDPGRRQKSRAGDLTETLTWARCSYPSHRAHGLSFQEWRLLWRYISHKWLRKPLEFTAPPQACCQMSHRSESSQPPLRSLCRAVR